MLRWFQSTGGGPGLADDYLLPPKCMWAMLERERSRADRNGGVFSLLTFDLAPDSVVPLVDALRHRLRVSDVAGMLRKDQLGVFLPDTPERGAQIVAEGVLQLLPAKVERPNVEVYVYPEPWWPEGKREGEVEESAHFGRSHTNGHAPPTDSSHPQRINHIVPRANSQNCAHDHGNGAGGLLRAQQLRNLYAQPLPWWKRGIDIAGALLGITLLSPVLITAGAAVKLTSPGPVFFRQKRSGLGARPFMIWKFRTMCDRADAKQKEVMHLNEQDGAAFKIKNDPRVTKLGKILRSTSIDELPQLWNVLRGEMSLVGPRPLPVHESEACTSWQQRRLDVTPGLTCIWQVEGRSSVKFEEWMRMDLRYARKRSLIRDVSLIARTIPAVLMRRGAS